MNNMPTVGRIVFGSKDAQQIIEADRALRLAEKKAQPGPKVYEVTIECYVEKVYQIKAADEGEARRNYYRGKLTYEDTIRESVISVEGP